MQSEDLMMDIGWAPIVSQAQAARTADRQALARHLLAARERTVALFSASCMALGDPPVVPHSPELNPPLWELGHIGWFADWWIARNPQRGLGVRADPQALRTPARQARRGLDTDALYDSSRVAHTSRWQLPLPDTASTTEDLAASLSDTLALLSQAPDTDDGLYFFRLALFHEDMHAEAAVYMAQTLGHDPFAGGALPHPPMRPIADPAASETLTVPAGDWRMGHQAPGFAFDNELGVHTLHVPAFQIDATPVTWGRYLPFIEAGGYEQARWWSEAGWAWRCAQQRKVPRYLRRIDTQEWERQRWGLWEPLDLNDAACHLSAFEAEAWCAWAGRRLPSEAEWAFATQTAPGFQWGHVWEWTATPFAPFRGFAPHPYVDYSVPWFDGRPVLKGASSATHPRMRHLAYRNYFEPQRNDVMAGFRSAGKPH
ncbi:selenoneine synthase SenA [Hydrogenophaga sp.]|uniref:selenoneine synthase SenA n=1 Tax=Hydrogenophaga sp. TaxID=1904254 RepID=UPI00271DCF33|nr:selenoneine synthase SenA [Hydrogenophaga sp.]MDO8905255.1 selenoneine synthase SenA [Hydrogenophaga sp.]